MYPGKIDYRIFYTGHIKLIVLINILFLMTLPAFGQLFYVNSYSPSWENDSIYRVEPDYSYTTVTIQGTLGDIALSPSGEMYGIYLSKLYHVNLETGELTLLVSLPDYSNALVCSNDYQLFTVGHSGVLYAYDLLQDTIRLVDFLGLYPGQYANDITFYSGNIIYQSYYGGDFYAYNIQDRDITRIICSSGGHMAGLGNAVDSCGSEMIYGIGNGGGLYEIDIDNNSFVLLHSFDHNFEAYGMATTSEHLASACYYHFTGDVCNNVGNLDIASQQKIILYPNPADNVLFFQVESKIESIDVYNSAGILVKTFDAPSSPLAVDDLVSGVYYFRLFTAGDYSNKIIVIR